jgi:hypothetical protein
VDWAVKQVLRLATGADVPQSQFARRQLERLRFNVDGPAVPRVMNSATAASKSITSRFTDG